MNRKATTQDFQKIYLLIQILQTRLDALKDESEDEGRLVNAIVFKSLYEQTNYILEKFDNLMIDGRDIDGKGTSEEPAQKPEPPENVEYKTAGIL